MQDPDMCVWCAILQLYGMYVGEGESVLRDTFRRARMASPSIIFLDEADALAPRRQEGTAGAPGAGGPDTGLRLLSTLLTEIDGLEETQGGLACGELCSTCHPCCTRTSCSMCRRHTCKQCAKAKLGGCCW